MKTVILVLLAGLAIATTPASAQERPVVFVHGFMSNGSTWTGAADRLRAQLAVTTVTPTLSSRELYETQAAQLQQQVGSWPADTVAVGHSNGGIVAREWSRLHPLLAVITVGTPHGGAPILANVANIFGFNGSIVNSFNGVYQAFAQGCCNWQWILSLYTNVWQTVASAAVSSLPRLATTVALDTTMPVTSEMRPYSNYLRDLNGAPNLVREANSLYGRVGVVSTARNFYYGGILRAAFPDDGDTVYALRELARFGLEAYAGYIYAQAAFDDWPAYDIASAMLNTAYYLRVMDDVWCRAVSTVGMTTCWTNDTVVPTWSQAYPNAAVIDTGWYGPAHTQEPRMSDALIEQALTLYAAVRPRVTEPPPPPPGPNPGGETPTDVTVYEHIDFSGASTGWSSSQSYVGSAWNDRVSSVRVPNGRTVVLYEHADFGGASLTLQSDATDLRAFAGPGVDGTWNDVASAIEIR